MADADQYDTGFQCEYRGKADEQQDDAYRADMLRAFRLKAWDGDAIACTLDRLFTRLRGMPGATALLGSLRTKYPQLALAYRDDDRSLFQILFSFDLFDKTHATICDLLEKGEMADGGLGALTENLG